MQAHDTEELKVLPGGDHLAVRVSYGRDEELRLHLESHGFRPQVRRASGRECGSRSAGTLSYFKRS